MLQVIFLIIFFSLSFFPITHLNAGEDAKECVIVLHGMGRTKYSMEKIERIIKQDGYLVWNETYPSTKQKIEDSSINHIQKGLDFCKHNNTLKINFVTHSLGGILVRYYLQDNSISNISNIVMLSPPNKGSELADYLKDTKLFQWATGPAGQQLGTSNTSLPNSMEGINATVGIITGNKTNDPWFSPIIPGIDDGKISVERAKLDEMTDFLVVESGHTFIMRNNSVLKQIKHFLKNGKFEKSR